jgi:hypothetical protein
METQQFDRLAGALATGRTRRGALRVLATAAFGVGLAALDEDGAAAKKKSKRKRPNGDSRPRGDRTPGGEPGGGRGTDAAVVAAYCARSGGAGSSRASMLGQPFIARQGGRLDRVDLSARAGSGGEYVVEMRDLTQGKVISNAPAVGSARVTVPAIAQGDGLTVTARFATDAILAADGEYALVVRFLGEGDEGNSFQIASAGDCFGAGALHVKPSGETAFTSYADLALVHTVYVVS